MLLAALALLAEIILPPHAPCVLVATTLSSNAILLNWQAATSEVAGVRWIDLTTTMMWDQDPAASSYDVVSGSIGSSTPTTCTRSGVPANGIVIDNPPPGVGWWFLVRARNVCGPGTWGATSTEERAIALACGG